MISSSIEPLEARIAPATIISATTVTFQDIDGDNVTIKVSKPIFTDDLTAANLIDFTGSIFTDGGPQQLNALFLQNLGAANNGLDVSITAKRSPITGGNGEVAFNSLDASGVDGITGLGTGIDLGKVFVQGDANSLDAGDGDAATPAIKSLDIRSIGAALNADQSDIFGSITKAKIRGSMQGKLIIRAGPGDPLLAGIGSLFVGGDIGAFNGAGGVVDVVGGIGTLTVKGSLVGGSVSGSGIIFAGKGIKTLTIAGSMIGGSAMNTGNVATLGRLETATIGGSLHGSENSTAEISAGSMGKVKIGHDVTGGAGIGSGKINSAFGMGGIDSLTIGGSLVGGGGSGSGRVQMGDGTVTIGGSIVGGGDTEAGVLTAGSLKSLVIKGDIIGGSSERSGHVFSNGMIKSMTVGGSVRGQSVVADRQAFVATIFAVEGIESLTINGDFLAGNIIAGIEKNGDQYGDGNDMDLNPGVTAKIGKLIIKGRASGSSATSNPLDHYGIEANEIGTLTVGGITFKNGDPSPGGPLSFASGFLLGTSGDLLVKIL